MRENCLLCHLCGLLLLKKWNVKVRNDSYSRGRWFEKKEISKRYFLFSPLPHCGCMIKSRSLVKFSALFSGPHGRFLLVGCNSYITPLMTRTSSCFLQPRLKVNLSGWGALQHPVLCIQCASETHARSLSLSPSPVLSMSLTLSVTAEDRRRDRSARALFIFYISPVLLLSLLSLTLFQLFLHWKGSSIRVSSDPRCPACFLFFPRRSSGCPPLHLKGK